MGAKFRSALSFALVTVICLAIATLLIELTGSDAGEAFKGFFLGIIGSSYSIAEVFVKATPLTLAGLGVAVAFRTGFINIGAEGQLYMGAIAATAIAMYFPGLPAIVMLPACMLGAFLLGGIWALIPGLLKARFGVSDVINTIMFNYIAISIVGILVQTVLKDPDNYFPQSPRLPEASALSILIKGTRLHTGVFIALIAAVLVYIIIFKTPIGFRMRAVGLNPRACKCMGISALSCVAISSMISGGLAGIAGFCEVTGLHHKLLGGISPSYGYLAIIVTLLGKNNPLGVVLAAIGIAALQIGSLAMQRSAGVPSAIAEIIMGVVVILIMARPTLFKKLLTPKAKGEQI